MTAKIFVVDGDSCMRELLQLHLRSAGYHVRQAEDAVVAGRMLLQSLPDLLIVDVDLPYLSGREFVATLVADQTIPFVPVIFITANDNFENHAALLGADCIAMPCRVDELLKLVARRLNAVGYAKAGADARAGSPHADATTVTVNV
jgi:DNA-binding response OmpR family regulator